MDIHTFFYIVGGGLCVLALTLSFIGMRKENFPNSREAVLGGLAGVFVIVAIACTGAVLAARSEQKERREELAHLAEEQAAQEGAEGEAPAEEQGGAPAEEAEPEPAPAAEETAEIDGAALFVSNGCGACHTFGAARSEATIGPSLDDVLPGQSPDQVAESIVEPGATISDGFGDGIMPTSFGTAMSEPEIEALVEYLLDNAG